MDCIKEYSILRLYWRLNGVTTVKDAPFTVVTPFNLQYNLKVSESSSIPTGICSQAPRGRDGLLIHEPEVSHGFVVGKAFQHLAIELVIKLGLEGHFEGESLIWSQVSCWRIHKEQWSPNRSN